MGDTSNGRRWWRERSTAGWRTVLASEAEDLEADLKRAGQPGTSDHEIAKDAIVRVRQSTEPPGGLIERIMDWFGGSKIEAGWTARNRARSALLGIWTDSALRAQIPSVRRSVNSYVDPNDPQRSSYVDSLDRLEQMGHPIADEERQQLRAIRGAADHASDVNQRNIRRFRNLLALTSAAVAVALVVLVVVHAVDPSLVTVCAASGSNPCPTGPSPAAFDVAVVELVGLLGGLLAAIVPLARTRRPEGPYSLWGAEVGLKASAGAATGLAGVLLMQGGLLPGLEPQPGSQVVAYALLFGLVQQLLTHFVDNKVGELASKYA